MHPTWANNDQIICIHKVVHQPFTSHTPCVAGSQLHGQFNDIQVVFNWRQDSSLPNAIANSKGLIYYLPI